MGIVITVLGHDIATGQRHDPRLCPIGLAATRAFDLPMCAGFRTLRVLATEGKVYALPEEACDFMAAFDRREPVAPFSFAVEEITEEQAFTLRQRN